MRTKEETIGGIRGYTITLEEREDMVFPDVGKKLLITDLCYVFDNDGINREMWKTLVDMKFPADESMIKSGRITIQKNGSDKRVEMFFGNTKHGDGKYEIDAHELGKGSTGVDSGEIGVITLEDAKTLCQSFMTEEEMERFWEKAGFVTKPTHGLFKVEFDPEGCNYEGGDLTIYTDGEECEECGERDCDGECEEETCPNCRETFIFREGCGDFCSKECEEEAEEEEEED